MDTTVSNSPAGLLQTRFRSAKRFTALLQDGIVRERQAQRIFDRERAGQELRRGWNPRRRVQDVARADTKLWRRSRSGPHERHAPVEGGHRADDPPRSPGYEPHHRGSVLRGIVTRSPRKKCGCS